MLENIHFVSGFSQSDPAVVRSLLCISQRALYLGKHGQKMSDGDDEVKSIWQNER